MERACHPSKAQVVFLLEFLEKYPSLAKGFPKVPNARDAARRSWEKLALQLNSLGGCVKSWKQWTKYWADKKSAVKKKSALRYGARNKTGGEAEMVKLSDVEEKILMLMGGESFATGHRQLRLNPFETSTAINSSQGQGQASDESVSVLQPELLKINAIVPKIEDDSNPSMESDTVITARIPQNAVRKAPSPPCTPTPPVTRPANQPIPSIPSGSGAHPSGQTINFRSRLSESPMQNQPPSPITTLPSRLRQRRQREFPQSQQMAQFSRMMERFLAIEEQRIEVDRRNSQLFEAIMSREMERDTSTIQALLAIGEGLKLLGQALNK